MKERDDPFFETSRERIFGSLILGHVTCLQLALYGLRNFRGVLTKGSARRLRIVFRRERRLWTVPSRPIDRTHCARIHFYSCQVTNRCPFGQGHVYFSGSVLHDCSTRGSRIIVSSQRP